MINAAFFVTGLDSGGIENYLLRFLQQNSNKFDKIVVFCKGGKLGHLEAKYRAIENVTILSKKIEFLNPFSYTYLYRFFQSNMIETVCDFTGNFAGLVLLSAKLAGVKTRISFYRGSTNHFKETKFKLLYNSFVKKVTYKYATHILSNSVAALDFFFPDEWKTDSRFDVIYNGVPAESFIGETSNLRSELNIPENAFVVGHTGRYNSAKNHATIIKVAATLCDKFDDIYFIMCGSGVADNLSGSSELEKFKARIFTFNNRSDIPKVLNTLDCYYFPSITEGQPNSLLEAMVAGIRFVASDIAPIKEAIPENRLPQLIPALNAEMAVKKIEEVRAIRSRDEETRAWAMNKYNPFRLFESFYNKLIE